MAKYMTLIKHAEETVQRKTQKPTYLERLINGQRRVKAYEKEIIIYVRYV